jgi:hypothetical protein
LARKPVENRQRWEDNIRMDLREIGWESMDWMNLAQGRYEWWALVNIIPVQ